MSETTPETKPVSPAPAPTQVPSVPASTLPAVDTSLPPQDEKKVLMARARVMGVKFSPNIGVDALRAKINEAMDKGPIDPEEDEHSDDEDSDDDELLQVGAAKKREPKLTEAQKEAQKRSKIQKEALKLVRVRITCLNSNKKDLPGEIFTIANRYIGTVKKYVPFGEATDNGYHIPNCIYQHLKERKFLQIRTKKAGGLAGDTPLVQTSEVPEFAIEVFPQLTKQELHALAQRQAMANGTTAAAD